jgi:dipeptide/tripeptide permease
MFHSKSCFHSLGTIFELVFWEPCEIDENEILYRVIPVFVLPNRFYYQVKQMQMTMDLQCQLYVQIPGKIDLINQLGTKFEQNEFNEGPMDSIYEYNKYLLPSLNAFERFLLIHIVYQCAAISTSKKPIK